MKLELVRMGAALMLMMAVGATGSAMAWHWWNAGYTVSGWFVAVGMVATMSCGSLTLWMERPDR